MEPVEVWAGERLDRDFILRFRVGNEAVHSSLILKPDGASREGTFLLTQVPPRTVARCGVRARPLRQHGRLEDGDRGRAEQSGRPLGQRRRGPKPASAAALP